MKTTGAFLLGGLSVLALLAAFLFGRMGSDLRTTFEPIPAGDDPAAGGWRLALEYQGLPAGRAGVEEVGGSAVEAEATEAPPRAGERAASIPPAAEAPASAPQGRAPRVASGGRLTKAPPDPVEVSGPDLLGWHPNGRPSFVGHQYLDAERGWVRDGDWQAWHENGERHEDGAYRDGVEHGPWQWWHDNGLPMAEGRFAQGQRVGHWRFWYDNGALQMEGDYADGVGTGFWTHYYESGGKKAQGRFEGGKPAGPWQVWTPRGELDREKSGEFLAGVRVD